VTRTTFLLMTLLGVASCTASPRSLGITGPNGAASADEPARAGSPPDGANAAASIPSLAHSPSAPGSASSMDDDAAIQPPGAPTDFGTRYAPSLEPTYGSDGRFYGYN
jgi:hypothetical protein